MILYEKNKPLLKRVPTVVDHYDYVQGYDRDNLYPQRCEETISRSYTLKGALMVLSDFINGEGFEDQNLNAVVVNDKGEFGGTLRDLLNQVSKTYAKYEACAFHVQYNLNYRIASITHIPFEYCRLGLADENGKVDEIKYSTNWEFDNNKAQQTQRKVVSYRLFNPDPEVVAQEIEDCDGIEHYKGQIFYWTPEEFQYPKSTFDPVFEHAQTQYEAGVYKVSALQNGFMATTIIAVPPTNAKGERNNLIEELRKKKGSQGANGILGLEVDGEFDIDKMVKTLSPTNVDTQWQYTETSSRDAVMENYGMPKELLGVRPESGMFNQANMEQAYVYFNSITRNKRAAVSRILKYLFSFWDTPIVSDFKIKEQTYTVQASTVTPGLPASNVARNLSGKEMINFNRVLRKFNKGEMTAEQAKVFLKPYGFTEEEMNLFLNDDPSDDPKILENG